MRLFTVASVVTARFLVMVKHATTFPPKLRIIWVFLICAFEAYPICTWTSYHFLQQDLFMHACIVFLSEQAYYHEMFLPIDNTFTFP